MTLTFKGFNAHPGYAKGRMVSAIKLAAEFVHRLPRHGLSPETTDRLRRLRASAQHPGRRRTRHGEDAAARLRDARASTTRRACSLTWPTRSCGRFPPRRFRSSETESYRNMKEVLDRYPEVVEHAKTAMKRAGLTPRFREIRGGTDGARLSFMGLPTPNLFAGEHNIHSRLEWTSVQDMDKAVEVIVEICRSWAEGMSGPGFAPGPPRCVNTGLARPIFPTRDRQVVPLRCTARERRSGHAIVLCRCSLSALPASVSSSSPTASRISTTGSTTEVTVDSAGERPGHGARSDHASHRRCVDCARQRQRRSGDGRRARSSAGAARTNRPTRSDASG